jgi:hypothetical protein
MGQSNQPAALHKGPGEASFVLNSSFAFNFLP